jgi:hypothetical protein
MNRRRRDRRSDGKGYAKGRLTITDAQGEEIPPPVRPGVQTPEPEPEPELPEETPENGEDHED